MKANPPPAPVIRLRPWGEADLPLLRALNIPEMTEHLGGPETEQQVAARHRRYVDSPLETDGDMFVIETAGGTPAGLVGCWPRRWRDKNVYETGWGVLPTHQGHGIATTAATLVAALARRDRRTLHAYPSVHHPASNAICRGAGFTLVGPTEFEYPPGQLIKVNDRRLDLHLDDPTQDSHLY